MNLFGTRGWSLRRKLIVACVLVELGAMVLVLFGGTRLMQRTLEEQATAQAREVMALLDQALVDPLAQRDYAAVQSILDQVRTPQTMPYLVVFDHRDRLIASAGWDAQRPLPARDIGPVDLDRADPTLHRALPVRIAGQQIARIELGLSTLPLRQARDEFRATGVFIAAVALAVSVGLLAAIAYALTRHLAVVAAASRAVAAGRYDIQVPVPARDEIGLLAASFNSMADEIRQRMAALEESRRQQQLHLGSAREERARLVTLLGALRSGILFVDDRQRVIYANAMFSQIWSLGPLAAGTDMAQVLPALRQQVASTGSRSPVDVLLTAPQAQALADDEIALADGRLIAQRMHQVDDGVHGARGCIWLHQDITLERQTQQRARLALVDPLTELMNRRGLFEELHLAIGRAEAAGTSVSLLFVDLDDFKHANDIAGHWAGDQILVMVARALTGLLQPGQQVARIGSDEFAVIAPCSDAEQLASLAARLVQSISALRFDLDEHRIRIGCSIGVAMYPRDAGGADQLVACADRAMHQAKLGGKNGYCVYQDDSAVSHAESERVRWNGRIYGALRDHRLELHFQPVHRMSDLGIVYYEALVRMVDEDDASRLIAPTDFVPHAERSGKIRQIDRWVFQACIDKLAQSPAAVCIAANLSARSLEDPSFVEFLREALRRSAIEPHRLHIELTETAAMGDLLAARPMIAALRSVGCAVHLDDFGSGFSSFVHLKLLEVDGIKIDGSFIRDLTSDPSSQLVVASLVKIARSLNKTTVAECVEDAATLDALRELGVDHVQGFHLGRPARKLAERGPRDHLSVVTPLRRGAGGTVD